MMKDTDKGWTIGCRSHCAIRLDRCSIIELLGGSSLVWHWIMDVCSAITL